MDKTPYTDLPTLWLGIRLVAMEAIIYALALAVAITVGAVIVWTWQWILLTVVALLVLAFAWSLIMAVRRAAGHADQD